jgi:hypothetical protein
MLVTEGDGLVHWPTDVPGIVCPWPPPPPGNAAGAERCKGKQRHRGRQVCARPEYRGHCSWIAGRYRSVARPVARPFLNYGKGLWFQLGRSAREIGATAARLQSSILSCVAAAPRRQYPAAFTQCLFVERSATRY